MAFPSEVQRIFLHLRKTKTRLDESKNLRYNLA